jgi:hypothetical protein
MRFSEALFGPQLAGILDMLLAVQSEESRRFTRQDHTPLMGVFTPPSGNSWFEADMLTRYFYVNPLSLDAALAQDIVPGAREAFDWRFREGAGVSMLQVRHMLLARFVEVASSMPLVPVWHPVGGAPQAPPPAPAQAPAQAPQPSVVPPELPEAGLMSPMAPAARQYSPPTASLAAGRYSPAPASVSPADGLYSPSPAPAGQQANPVQAAPAGQNPAPAGQQANPAPLGQQASLAAAVRGAALQGRDLPAARMARPGSAAPVARYPTPSLAQPWTPAPIVTPAQSWTPAPAQAQSWTPAPMQIQPAPAQAWTPAQAQIQPAPAQALTPAPAQIQPWTPVLGRPWVPTPVQQPAVPAQQPRADLYGWGGRIITSEPVAAGRIPTGVLVSAARIPTGVPAPTAPPAPQDSRAEPQWLRPSDARSMSPEPTFLPARAESRLEPPSLLDSPLGWLPEREEETLETQGSGAEP